MPSAAECREPSGKCQGISHCLESGYPVYDDGDLELVLIFCSVVRDRGVYGDAVVRYQIMKSDNETNIAVGDVFINVAGLVSFVDRQFNAKLSVTVLHTSIPHFDLHYVVRLLNVTGRLSFLFVLKVNIIIQICVVPLDVLWCPGYCIVM